MKTVNAIRNTLARFDEMKGIGADEREAVWNTIRGAALSHGIRTEQRTFPRQQILGQNAEAQTPEPPIVVTKFVPCKDPKLEAILTMADRQASLVLRHLGLE